MSGVDVSPVLDRVRLALQTYVPAVLRTAAESCTCSSDLRDALLRAADSCERVPDSDDARLRDAAWAAASVAHAAADATQCVAAYTARHVTAVVYDAARYLPYRYFPAAVPERNTRRQRVLIRTHYDPPPIPDRRHDWRAVTADYEPGAPVGYGRTEQEAIADLREQLADLSAGESARDDLIGMQLRHRELIAERARIARERNDLTEIIHRISAQIAEIEEQLAVAGLLIQPEGYA